MLEDADSVDYSEAQDEDRSSENVGRNVRKVKSANAAYDEASKCVAHYLWKRCRVRLLLTSPREIFKNSKY